MAFLHREPKLFGFRRFGQEQSVASAIVHAKDQARRGLIGSGGIGTAFWDRRHFFNKSGLAKVGPPGPVRGEHISLRGEVARSTEGTRRGFDLRGARVGKLVS